MTVLGLLIPISTFLGLLGAAAFLWSVRANQYDDLDGAAARILSDDRDDAPEAPAPAAEDQNRPVEPAPTTPWSRDVHCN